MRTVPSGLLSSQTRCIAVKVVRKDGVTWGLSDTNVPFVYEGVTYTPYNGIDASTIQQSVGTSPGNLTVKTIQSAIADQITDADLIGRFYDGAQVWVYEIDYLNPGNGAMILGRYFVAKATLHDSSKEIELVETLYRLKNVTGRVLASRCDVARYGDKRCDPSQTIRARDSFSRTVTAVPDLFTIEFGGDDQPAGFYSFGEVIWTSGANVGAPAGDVKVHTIGGSHIARIVLRTPFGNPVEVGDVATLVRGCDRLRTTCQSIVNSHNPSGTNIENHQGFYLPIPDDVHVVGRQHSS